MTELSIIQEIFFEFLMQYHFEADDLDYSLLDKHLPALGLLSEIGNSGVSVFDLNRKQMVFYSSNFGSLLGYNAQDYEDQNYQFFDARIHPEDKKQLALNGVSVLKIFNAFSKEEKMCHKQINEYRMLNAEGKYVRLMEQYQVLELDQKGQLWLLLNLVDVSPDQSESGICKSKLVNFKTGEFIPFETPVRPELELTKRELEILKLVKEGYLSKEISDRLSISFHTVNTHRQRLLEKLGAANSIEAVRFASRYGLLD